MTLPAGENIARCIEADATIFQSAFVASVLGWNGNGAAPDVLTSITAVEQMVPNGMTLVRGKDALGHFARVLLTAKSQSVGYGCHPTSVARAGAAALVRAKFYSPQGRMK